METVEFTRGELLSLVPARNVLTQDLEIGTYSYEDVVVNKTYNTKKYVYKHDTTEKHVSISFKNFKAMYIDGKSMLEELTSADKYKLASSFEVVKKDPEPETSKKHYPMYALKGYDEFQSAQKANGGVATQAMYDTLFATEPTDEHKDKYYRKLHIASPILIPA